MQTRKTISLLSLTGAALLAASLASAQENRPTLPSLNAPEVEPFDFRVEPTKRIIRELENPFNYQGNPITFGSFRVWPNLTLRQEYDDNIFATKDGKESDFISVVTPALEAWKSFGRHNFKLRAESEIRHHWDNDSENIQNHSLAFDGDIEARKVLNIPVRVTYNDRHLSRKTQRRSSANQLAVAPLNIKRLEAESGFVYKPNRLELSLLGNYKSIRLGNEDLINGGRLIRDNRDSNSKSAKARLTYDLKEDISPFLEVSYTDQEFINEYPSLQSRNNTSTRVLAGANFNFKDLVTGFIGLGLDNNNFEENSIESTNDISLNAKVSWEPTTKTSLTLNASRATSEDNELIAQLTETNLGLEVQHELQKDLFGRVNLDYKDNNFSETGRRDTTYDLGFEAIKFITPNLHIGAGYSFTTQNSTINGLGFNNSVIFLRARLAL